MNKGMGYAIGAYLTWGLFPIYWRWLHHVPSLQVVSHRIVWSCVILTGVIMFSRQAKTFRSTVVTPLIIRTYLLTAILISINWLVYIWGVNHDFIIETSLGYFINPLLSVFLGVVFLGERLRRGQWLPIGLATTGVLYLTFVYGELPWIALTLASSFALYGLVKKTAPLGSLYGLTLETTFLFIPAMLYLVYTEVSGEGAFLHTGGISDLLMVGAGLVTTIPLLMFASAVQRIPLSMIGILQYITPSMQFLLGVLVYKEAFNFSQFIGFAIVWLALIIFGIEGFIAHRGAQTAVAA